MSVSLDIEKEKSSKKVVVNILGGLLFLGVCLFFTAIVSLAVTYLIDKGANDDSLKKLIIFFKRVAVEPFYLFEAYGQWWRAFVESIQNGSWRFSLFVPFAVPVVFIAVLILVFIKSSFSFSLWYMMHYRFARSDDVQKMNILGGAFLVLGLFYDKILSLFQPASVFCLGETGSGKTSGIAVPSILHSDGMSVLAVDTSGALAKYTSGYRSRIGKVFYFNWDLQDDAEKGAFYPRWNPLGRENLPPIGVKRSNYLEYLSGFLAEYDLDTEENNYWHWLVRTTFETFLHFMVSKTEQAKANDYFLAQIIEKQYLNKDDKDILLSYYFLMPSAYASQAMKNVEADKLTFDDYFPVGSWEGIPSEWQGRDLCLSMVADWFFSAYLHKKNDTGDWLGWLESLLQETVLFNYSLEAVIGLKQLISLSKVQRKIVFSMLLKPLMVFRNPQIRERTTGNDFNLSMLGGIKNPENKKLEPVTVYSTANTRSTKFVARLFVETLFRYHLSKTKNHDGLPMFVVMDDIAQMLKIRTLKEAVARGPRKNLSFLLLCNSLHHLEDVYGCEAVENLVANTNYKIIMAEKNKIMSRQLNKLAVYATKSVQIPVGGKKGYLQRKHPADANYYHRLAGRLSVHNNISIDTFGYHLVLAEGFYHRPVLAKNISFLQDEQFKSKALTDAEYVLDETLMQQRNAQDMEVPDAEEMIVGEETGIDDELELQQYVDLAYDDAVSKIEEAEQVLPPDVEKAAAAEEQKPQDWWLSEQAFDVQETEETKNPFGKK